MLTQVKGSQPFAVVLLQLKDIPPLPRPMSDFATLVSPAAKSGLFTFWRDVTYGQVDVAGSKIFGWWTAQYAFADVYTPGMPAKLNRSGLIAEARRLAAINKVDLSIFSGLIVIVNAEVDGSNSGTDCVVPVMGEWGQEGWRWCKKCQALAWAGGSPGKCVVGGVQGSVHDHTGSGEYLMAHGMPSFPGEHYWGYCCRCQGLAFSGPEGKSVCIGGVPHDFTQSGDYAVPNHDPNFPGQHGWRWCSKCNLLSFGPQAPGPCAAVGLHDHSASPDYTLVSKMSSLNLYFVAHESGHALGMVHSRDFAGNDYGDPLDLMSGPHGGFQSPVFAPAGPGINAPTLLRCGWMPSGRVASLDLGKKGSQKITLVPVNHPELQGSFMGRVVTPDRIYTVELRHPSAWDTGVLTPTVFIHELRTLFTAGQNGWRMCVKCHGLNFAGAAACAAGGCHDLSNSGPYSVRPEKAGAGQPGWRYCSKCQSLAFGGGASAAGVCAAGGAHEFKGSGNYALPLNDPNAIGQKGWRYCGKCVGLFFAGSNLMPRCPAGGLHDSSKSGNYVVQSVLADPDAQDGWRLCRKCQGLFFAGATRCAAGDFHNNAGSLDYSLLPDQPGALGQPAWKWCSKCQNLGFSGHATQGVCPAGDGHDFSGSVSYRIPAMTAGAIGEGQWRWCSKCEALASMRDGAGPCPKSGKHDHSTSQEYVLASHRHDHTYSIGGAWLPGTTFKDSSRGVAISVDQIAANGLQAKVTISRV